MTRSILEFQREEDEAPRSSNRFNLVRLAQEQMDEDLNRWTPPEPVPSLRDLESGRRRPLMVDVALPEKRLQSRTPESAAREAEPLT